MAVDRKSPRAIAAAASRCVVGLALESIAALGLCLGALAFVHPVAWSQARTHLYSMSIDIYRIGDFGGTLFLVSRAAAGESGDRTRLIGAPTSFRLTDDFPNTEITDLLGALVARLGMAEGYNLGLALLLATNGAAVWLAVRLLGGPRGGRIWPAAAAGVVAAVAPMMAAEALRGRPVTCWVAPAIAATALCVASVRSWRSFWLIVPGALCLDLAIRVYAFYPVLLLPWTLTAAAAALWPLDRWKIVRAVGGLAVALVAIRETLQETWARGGMRLSDDQKMTTWDLPMHLERLSVPDALSTAVGAPDLERLPALIPAAALVAGLIGWRRTGRWMPPLLLAALLMSISLGAEIDLGDQTLPPKKTPYVLALNEIPLLRGAPRPTRYAIPGSALAAAAMGLGLAAMFRRRVSTGEAGRDPAGGAPLDDASGAARGAPGRLTLAVDRAALWTAAPICAAVAYGVLFQTRPQRVSATLAWHPMPQLVELLGDEEVLMDLPLVFAEPQSNLAQFSMLPVKRVNPPGLEIDAWRGRMNEREHPCLLAASWIAQRQAVPPNVAARAASGCPEIEGMGLRRAVLHQQGGDERELARWKGWLDQLGAEIEYWDQEIAIYALPSPGAASLGGAVEEAPPEVPPAEGGAQ